MLPNGSLRETEPDVLRSVTEILRKLLPTNWRLAVEREPAVDARHRADAVITLTAPDGSQNVLVVECKATLVTRDLPTLRDQLRVVTGELAAPAVPVVASRYLSPAARQWLDENGLSYVDATGNIRLDSSQPALFLRDRGADRDPWRGPGRPRGTLQGEPAARVVRALVDFATPPTISELLQRSGASTGATYRVIDFLRDEGLLERDPRGPIRSVAWRRLLERWSQDYGFQRTNAFVRALAPRGLSRLMTDLAASKFRYAVTGSLAARQWEAYAPARLATVYVDDAEAALDELSLRQLETGANVLLAVPKFDVVFDRTMVIEGVSYASPSQSAVDLLTGPGRQPAEGQALLDWMEMHESAWRR